MHVFRLAGILAIGALTGTAQAATINISGTPGQGFVTVSFDGTAQIRGSGTIRDTAANTFNEQDTVQFFSFLNDVTIQDQVIALAGNLTLTTGLGNTQITGLFLDDDAASDDADDIGFRGLSDFAYTLAGHGNWALSGSAIAMLDIAVFNPGNYPLAAVDTPFAARDQISLNVVSNVPLPPALPALGAGLIGLAALTRHRRHIQA